MAERLFEQSVNADQGKISFEDFLRLYDGQHAEWLDGEVILMTPPSVLHQRLIGFLHHLLDAFLSLKPLGETFLAPFAMKIVGRAHGREPDMIFLKTEHQDRLQLNYLDGPADIAIEVVSPESFDRDHSEKFREYEAAGIPEYWLIDPIRHDANFYHLAPLKNAESNEELRYRRIEPDSNGDFHSVEMPGFRLHIETLWADKLPDFQDCLAIVQAMLKS